MRRSKPVLVGELNPYGPDPRWALWPDPPGCAGGRLCHVVLAMEVLRYLDTFDRVNLCTGRWSKADAQDAARRVMRGWGRIVALGAKVAGAFGVPFEPFTVKSLSVDQDECIVAVLPHPSGRSRIWNGVGSYQRARDTVASLLDLQVKEGS